jgi:ABC-type nitrate/sulfonate/bicarbonate transport system ATPase subunit
MVMVTHDVSEAIALGNRIIVLGGSPAGIVYDYKSPQQNTKVLFPEDPTISRIISQALTK